MRPTLSELGEYDGTALMEFKTKKEIIYQIHSDTVCTYEMDDTPPFELNEEALDIAIEISMLLNCNLVSEVHISRKQYLDGSIPTGFQRTTILGIDGWIQYGRKKIRIRQLGLEEDACREVSDKGHVRIYRTDRLGIPLVETVTYPDMKTPWEAYDVAQLIRYLTRSTGKVRTGIGAARQDVNVSIRGGRRVEIKGVPRIPMIPLLVHNEAFRQANLLEIRDELKKRGITHSSFKAFRYDVTENLRGTMYSPIAKAIDKGFVVGAVLLKGYRGILSKETQPGTIFAKEISDRVRVIACVDHVPNIVHSDSYTETLSSSEWNKLKKITGMEDNDTIVLVWSKTRDIDTAIEEIIIRAEEAIDGVPNETRQALPDATNGFERILPGPNRMYPDTDLPPIAITNKRISRIAAQLPELPWDAEKRYKNEMKLGKELAAKLSISPYRKLFEKALTRAKSFPPKLLASFMVNRLPWLTKKNLIPNFSETTFISIIETMEEKKLPPDAIEVITRKACGKKPAELSKIYSALQMPDKERLANEAVKLMTKFKSEIKDKEKLRHFIMGILMRKYRGGVRGKDLWKIVESTVK